MKFLIQIALTALLAWIFQGLLHFPWWTVVIAAMAAAVPNKLPAGRSFLAGLMGIFILWALVAFQANAANDSILAAQAGKLFGGAPPLALVVVTGLIGGFVGGLGAMAGSLLEQNFGKKAAAK
ncbi:MAG: hypothetical protein H6581_03690 [Bacteroidia bacterium]|nr:hypothetical protein [Bacteroidia bacterium]